MNLLGETIRYHRQLMGMSAAALSREVDMSSSYVAKVESGKIDPSVKAFSKIALVLGLKDIEIAWLVRAIAVEKETDAVS